MDSELAIIKVLVVDDEPLARDLMCSVLAKLDAVEVVGTANNGRQAISETARLSPDLLLLDIEMPAASGFDVVRSLQSDVMPLVVFATAFDHYAVAAFELNAVDYLLKPFDPVRIAQSIERARARLLRERGDQRKGQLLAAMDGHQLMAEVAWPDSRAAKLAITDGGSTTLVAFDSIDWVDAAGDYMCVHSQGKTYVMRSTLKDLEEKLAGSTIVRVHRSTLVNLDKICEIGVLPKGERQLTLDNGASIKVSRNYRDALSRLTS